MAKGDQVNIRPEFQTTKLPCEGTVGDLIVLTPLKENEPDPSPQGVASLWFCTKSGSGERHPAVWQRVTFDGFAQCDAPVGNPPQNRPRIRRG